MLLPRLSTELEAVCKIGLMSCLSVVSLRFIIAGWLGYPWEPEDRRTGEGQEPAAFNPASPYKWTEHAVYRLENDKPAFSPKRPLPVCLPKQTETIRASRISSFENYASECSHKGQDS